MESETDNSIAVFYNFREEKITEEYIKKMIQTTSKVKKFFLVVPSIEKGKAKIMNIDKKALTFVQELGRKDRDETIQPIRIELFMDDDLLYNVLKHDLVPEHKLLSETEKK